MSQTGASKMINKTELAAIFAHQIVTASVTLTDANGIPTPVNVFQQDITDEQLIAIGADIRRRCEKVAEGFLGVDDE